jgi:hypothetical protein
VLRDPLGERLKEARWLSRFRRTQSTVPVRQYLSETIASLRELEQLVIESVEFLSCQPSNILAGSLPASTSREDRGQLIQSESDGQRRLNDADALESGGREQPKTTVGP